jgi:DNA-binding MarR family transcriptional regulator
MTEKDIQRIRDFNRFYTNIIGLVDNHILNSKYSLPEARVLYELFHHQPCTASTIMTSISMDKGYMSRVLKSFEKKGLLNRKQSKEDGRASTLVLTAKGIKEFEGINQASASQIKDLLSNLNSQDIQAAIEHMEHLKEILSKTSR